MYLHITDKCNMSCAHCCNSCGPDGEHMPRHIWKQAIKFSKSYDESISIGGGEPTLHPDFWEILGLCIGTFSEYVWLATNGSQTDTAIALAGLAKKGVIGCALSIDEWHDPISEKVVAAFTKDKNHSYGIYSNNTPDAREIRRIKKPYRAGRWKDGKIGCVCSDIYITPTGDIKGCGCINAKNYGTVFNPNIPTYHEYGECTLDQPVQ